MANFPHSAGRVSTLDRCAAHCVPLHVSLLKWLKMILCFFLRGFYTHYIFVFSWFWSDLSFFLNMHISFDFFGFCILVGYLLWMYVKYLIEICDPQTASWADSPCVICLWSVWQLITSTWSMAWCMNMWALLASRATSWRRQWNPKAASASLRKWVLSRWEVCSAKAYICIYR